MDRKYSSEQDRQAFYTRITVPHTVIGSGTFAELDKTLETCQHSAMVPERGYNTGSVPSQFVTLRDNNSSTQVSVIRKDLS